MTAIVKEIMHHVIFFLDGLKSVGYTTLRLRKEFIMKFRLFWPDGEPVSDKYFGNFVEFDTEAEAARAVEFHKKDGIELVYMQIM